MPDVFSEDIYICLHCASFNVIEPAKGYYCGYLSSSGTNWDYKNDMYWQDNDVTCASCEELVNAFYIHHPRYKDIIKKFKILDECRLMRYIFRLTLKGIIIWRDLDKKEILEYAEKYALPSSLISYYLL